MGKAGNHGIGVYHGGMTRQTRETQAMVCFKTQTIAYALKTCFYYKSCFMLVKWLSLLLKQISDADGAFYDESL